jgi:hypothetical protein
LAKKSDLAVAEGGELPKEVQRAELNLGVPWRLDITFTQKYKQI